mmetsp:Transcript_121049/g.189905  ORF Transcript_121049/g.189905 Transcript_121049/m.189905 type:complete len:258 (+) Transcript_121049:262-1035(+)
MSLCVHFLHLFCIYVSSNEFREVSLIFRWIFFLHHLHVLLDVIAQDTVLVSLSVVLRIGALLLCRFVSREILRVVRNVQPSIHCSLECSPHASAHTRASDTDVKDTLQGALISLLILNVKFFSIGLLLPFEGIIETELLQGAPCDEQSSRIRCCIVLVAARNAKLLQLSGCSLRYNFISSNRRVGDLANDLSVREADNKTVLLVVVLVLVLANHLSASLEIRLAFATTTLLHLESLKEGCVLQDLDESHDSCRKRRN